MSRAALLALVPLAVLALVHPPALDDAATTRVAQAATQPSADSGVQVEPLAGDPDTPEQMTFNELSIRANASNGQQTLKGRMLSLEGFVSKSQDGAPARTVRVGRHMIWCCAADAAYGAAFVRWPTGTAAPAAGSWFTVVGRVDGFATADFTAVPLVSAQRTSGRNTHRKSSTSSDPGLGVASTARCGRAGRRRACGSASSWSGRPGPASRRPLDNQVGSGRAFVAVWSSPSGQCPDT